MSYKNCGVCKLDKGGFVLHQNKFARAICPHKKGDKCEAIDFTNINDEEGFQDKGVLIIDKVRIDHVVLPTDSGFTVFLCDVSDQLDQVAPEEQLKSLTKAECIILNKILKKESNSEIADSLCIAASTLKTHLSHIYQKLPCLLKWRKTQKR